MDTQTDLGIIESFAACPKGSLMKTKATEMPGGV